MKQNPQKRVIVNLDADRNMCIAAADQDRITMTQSRAIQMACAILATADGKELRHAQRLGWDPAIAVQRDE